MSGMTHNNFLSHFRNGIMKPNRYEVEFNLPIGVSQAISGVNPEVTVAGLMLTQNKYNSKGGVNIKCHTATLPQRTLQTWETMHNASPIRVPYSQVYDPVTFSFYADGNADTRWFFDLWQQAAVNVKTNTMNFYDEYTSNVTITVLNEADKPVYGVTLFDAYPLSVGAMDLSYSQNNNYQTVVATLTYRRWEAFKPRSGLIGNVTVGGITSL